MANGTIILLNGSSSSGKTTLARALQQVLAEPYQHIALDQFRDGLPDRLRGMNAPPGTSGAAGLNVVPATVDGEAVTHICFGATGNRVKRAMRRCVAALAEEGVNVVVDDLLLARADLEDYVRVLAPFRTYLIAVRAPLPVLTAREEARGGRFPGTARSHHRSVHAHGADYDLEIDTALHSPSAAAQAVMARLDEPPAAIAAFRTREGDP
ncbi:MAG: AAA family ATPase [Pseudomonadota bacterium]